MSLPCIDGAAERLRALRGLVCSHTASMVTQAGPKPRPPVSSLCTRSGAGAGVRQAGHSPGEQNLRRYQKAR